MEKNYEVKVYDKTGEYLTTWTDVVSEIEYSCEINTAGGSMNLTLARNAGDYGEGSDVDFGHRVVVTCFDNEAPSGVTVFQGVISGYTPIYKDDKIEVKVLGYGSELGEYMYEGGDSAYITQNTSNSSRALSSGDGKGDFGYWFGQTFVIPDASKEISGASVKVTAPSGGVMWVSLYDGAGLGQDLLTEGSVSIPAGTDGWVRVSFPTPYTCTSGVTYNIQVTGVATVYTSTANPYAGGTLIQIGFTGTNYELQNTFSTEDLAFILYGYGGNTKRTFTNTEHTEVLTEVLSDYNSRSGILIPPMLPLDSVASQYYNSGVNSTGSWGGCTIQKLLPTENLTFNVIQLYDSPWGSNVDFRIYSGDPTLDSCGVNAGSWYYTKHANNTLVYSVAPTDYTTVSGNNRVTLKLNYSITLNAGTSYYIVFDGGMDGGQVSLGCAVNGNPIYSPFVAQYGFITNENNVGGSPTLNTSQISWYMRLCYTEDELPRDVNGGYYATGETMTYTFNVQTVLECVNVIQNLAPENWYWYIDQGNNVLNFKEKSDEPEHYFTLDKDVLDAKFDKRIEEIVNCVYFTGGDTGGGENLYMKFTNADSISKYGLKAKKVSDSRVTQTATATVIANNILATKSEPELRVTLEILDSNNDMGVGYDIESIKVGDVIAIRNVTQQVGLSTWDVARWDEAYWDYNIYNLSSMRMQIQKVTYSADKAVIQASTMPIDVNKRIEEVNRGLETLQIKDNPDMPS